MNQNTNEDCAINLSQRPSAATTPTDDSTTQSGFLVSNLTPICLYNLTTKVKIQKHMINTQKLYKLFGIKILFKLRLSIFLHYYEDRVIHLYFDGT